MSHRSSLKERIRTGVKMAVVSDSYDQRIKPPPPVVKQWQWGRWKVKYERRSPLEFWGRFGGGWQYALGFKASRSSLYLMLLTASLMISRVKGD